MNFYFCNNVGFFFQELERKAAELQRKEQEMKNMQINGKLLIFYVDCENIMGFYWHQIHCQIIPSGSEHTSHVL